MNSLTKLRMCDVHGYGAVQDYFLLFSDHRFGEIVEKLIDLPHLFYCKSNH